MSEEIKEATVENTAAPAEAAAEAKAEEEAETETLGELPLVPLRIGRGGEDGQRVKLPVVWRTGACI